MCSIIWWWVVGVVSADNSIALAVPTRIVSVMSLVWTIRTILISSFKALISKAHRTAVNSLVLFLSVLLLLLNETALGYLALTERWMAPATDGRGRWLSNSLPIQAHRAITGLELAAGLVAIWMVELCLDLHLLLLLGLVEFLIVGTPEIALISASSIMIGDHYRVILLWVCLILDDMVLIIRRLVL